MKITRAEALRRVAKTIVERPESYNQGDYCGTPCCIAGHLDSFLVGSWNGPWSANDIEQRAMDALGEECEAPDLFGPTLYNTPFRDEFRSAISPLERAIVAGKAIEHYIAERGPEAMSVLIEVVG